MFKNTASLVILMLIGVLQASLNDVDFSDYICAQDANTLYCPNNSEGTDCYWSISVTTGGSWATSKEGSAGASASVEVPYVTAEGNIEVSASKARDGSSDYSKEKLLKVKPGNIACVIKGVSEDNGEKFCSLRIY